MKGRVRSVSSRSGQSLCADQVSREYRYKRSSQLLHWYYALMLGALSSWPMMSGGGSSSMFRKAFSASRKMCGITAAGPVAARSRV